MSNTFTRDPRPRVQYSGDGSRATFPIPFPVLATDDLIVFIDDATAAGFAVSGLGEPAGAEVIFAEPPDAGTTITLLRRTEGIRESEFVDGAPFRAAAINAELDRIMLLIQEDREEHGRALRGGAAEGEADFCLPPAAARANRLLGFDSAGRPVAYGEEELPASGDASGLMVTPTGATTMRALGEHLAARVDVRDFGAIGDGVSDDSAAFAAAVAAARARGSVVHVPASGAAYVLGTPLMLDGVAIVGDGPGSLLKLALASGTGLELSGAAPRLVGLRLLGPGANAWPDAPEEVDLAGVTLDGVRIAAGTTGASLRSVEIAACHTALAVEGGLRAAVGCHFLFSRKGLELRAGASGPLFAGRSTIRACSSGIRADGAASLDQVSVVGGSFSACGLALELNGPSGAWRAVELSGLVFGDSLEADVQAGPRQSVALRACQSDASGKRAGSAIDLLAAGETVEAPNLIVEDSHADAPVVATVTLGGGTNLNLLQPGDLIVLATDGDDVDDLWTSLRATRGGLVHAVGSQSVASATLELARAATLPLLTAGDAVRVVGRFGTATATSVGPSAPADGFTWLRADDHCRVFAAHNPMAAARITVQGASADLRHFPGLSGEPVEISGVQLSGGAINGAHSQLVTFQIAQDAAVSFTPAAPIGMLHVFSDAVLGDPAACILVYRAAALGHTQILAAPATSDVEVMQLTPLTGITGSPDVFTFSATDDGRIHIENRKVGPPRKVSLFVVGAPL